MILIFILFAIIFYYFRLFKINKIEKFSQKFNLVVGSCFKNEAHILDEWITHYKYHGVDHIYLINDNSSDNYEEVLLPYINDNYVTLFDNKLKIDDTTRQKLLYKEYFKPIINNSTWWIIIDLDEFMYSPNYINLKEAIKPYIDYGLIFIKWKIFGSNGYIKQPKYVVPSFTKRKDDNSNFNGKSIINSKFLNNFDVHFHDTSANIINVDNIIINHYVIQSWSFFKSVKMTRGDVNNYVQTINLKRDKKYFDEYDYNEIDDFVLFEQNKSLYKI
jgi:hypothetical protein